LAESISAADSGGSGPSYEDPNIDKRDATYFSLTTILVDLVAGR